VILPRGSDSATSPRKLKISPKGTDFKHKEFRIREIQAIFFTKRGLFSQEGILSHNKSGERKV